MSMVVLGMATALAAVGSITSALSKQYNDAMFFGLFGLVALGLFAQIKEQAVEQSRKP